MMPSEYAKEANKAGLKIITWSIERSGPLANSGGWYYTGLDDAINNDGDLMSFIDVLAQEVGVMGIFSDCRRRGHSHFAISSFMASTASRT